MIFKSLTIGLILALAVVLLTIAIHPDATINEQTVTLKRTQDDAHQSSQVSSTSQSVTDSALEQNSLEAAVITAEPAATKLEIHGRVTDEINRPLEGVLISDELNFGSTRSNRDGSYKILIDHPKFKAPFLNFLRNGYKENRIGIPTHNTPAQSRYEINVKLHAATNTINANGWIGNEWGEGLGGRKIGIRSLYGQGAGIFYAVISDDSGGFSFEGIRADVTYKLEIEPSEQYAGYTLEPFRVSQYTPPTTIILDSLKLVDIEGLIVNADKAPVANFEIIVKNMSLDYPDRRIKTDSTGFFELRRFPVGELKLSTNAPEYFRITGLRIRAAEYQSYILAIDKGSYLLRGWISDENGVPIAKVRVTLNSEFSNDRYQSYSHRSMTTDSSGKFQFSNLGGTDHQITVYATGYDTYTVNHHFLSFSDRLEIRLSK